MVTVDGTLKLENRNWKFDFMTATILGHQGLYVNTQTVQKSSICLLDFMARSGYPFA